MSSNARNANQSIAWSVANGVMEFQTKIMSELLLVFEQLRIFFDVQRFT
jgi:hypothetical protein